MIGALFHRVFSNPSQIYNKLLLAAVHGDHRKLKGLLPLVDPSVLGPEALMNACINEHHKCVELLLPLTPTKDRRTVAKRLAEYGPEGTLLLLIEHDPDFAPMLLVNAVTGKNFKTAALLSGLTDTKHNNSLALQWAVVTGQHNMVDLLFETSDPEVALENIQKQHPHNSQRWAWFEEYIARTQKQEILSNIEDSSLLLPRTKRKM